MEMQKEKCHARVALSRINERVDKIFELNQLNQSNCHASKMRAWIEKIKQKHIARDNSMEIDD